MTDGYADVISLIFAIPQIIRQDSVIAFRLQFIAFFSTQYLRAIFPSSDLAIILDPSRNYWESLNFPVGDLFSQSH